MSTLLLLVLGCTDYSLKAPAPVRVPGDTGSADSAEDTDADSAGAETCDGTDDDGDGRVDEGFEDVDADGTADCVDDSCTLDVLPAGTISRSEACDGTAASIPDPWRSRVGWQWRGVSGVPCLNSVAMTPLVVQLTDDNGDGAQDADDDAEVVFVAIPSSATPACWTERSVIVILDAATGVERAIIDVDVYAGAMLAVADLDLDGTSELLAYDTANALHAWRVDGTELWSTGPLTLYSGGMPAVTVTDFEGDGTPEVVAQERVLEGPTGAERYAYVATGAFLDPTTADLDGDGSAELIVGGEVYAADGALRWTGLVPRDYFSPVYHLVLDIDGDPDGEVVQTESNRISVFDAEGAPLASARFSSGMASLPCAADLDADGRPEIVVPAQTELLAYGADATLRWSAPIKDTSTAAGCIAADLDGDGAAEVIFADEEAFMILDGRTGTVNLRASEHASGTLWETPAAVDVDHDGAMELLVASNDNAGADAWTGVTLLEHDGPGWAPGPTAWPSAARVADRQDDAGAVRSAGRWWDVENTYRGVGAASLATTPDVAVTITDACTASCDGDGLVSLALLVANRGATVLRAGTPVTLYARDAGTRTVVAELPLPADLSPGETTGTLRVDLPATALGASGVEATVHEGAADCHPDDNTAVWTEPSGCGR